LALIAQELWDGGAIKLKIAEKRLLKSLELPQNKQAEETFSLSE
jgi:hypothetical protein